MCAPRAGANAVRRTCEGDMEVFLKQPEVLLLRIAVVPIFVWLFKNVILSFLERWRLISTLYVDIPNRIFDHIVVARRINRWLEQTAGEMLPTDRIPFLSVLQEDHHVYKNVQSYLLTSLWGDEILQVRNAYRNLEIIEQRVERVDRNYRDLIHVLASRQKWKDDEYAYPLPVIVGSHIEGIQFQYDKIAVTLQEIVGKQQYENLMNCRIVEDRTGGWVKFRDCASRLFIPLRTAIAVLLIGPGLFLLLGIFGVAFAETVTELLTERPGLIVALMIALSLMAALWALCFYRNFLSRP